LGKVFVDIETDVLGGSIHYKKSYMCVIYKGKLISMEEYKLAIRKEKIDKILKNGK